MPKNYYNYVIETKLQNRISSDQRDAVINSVVGFPALDDMARLETGRIGNIFIGIGRPNGGADRKLPIRHNQNRIPFRFR